MSQTERGWADPKAMDIDQARERLRYLVNKSERRQEMERQVIDPTDQELAAEEAQLP